MKTLLFNGCSYTAGDKIVWEEFLKSHPHTENDPDRYEYYVEYRKQFNLPMICATDLNLEHIDIAMDGNSNYNIAIDTINHIISLPTYIRSNLHVCIGWTEPTRQLKWSEEHNKFVPLNVAMLETELQKGCHHYIKEAMVKAHDNDHYLNYIANVMLLENFLIANNITYTFWRALGLPVGSFDEPFNRKLNITEQISNNRNWICFNENDSLYMTGNAWLSILDLNRDFITVDNLHPNIDSIKRFSTIFSKKLVEQQIVN
jgi:hypothetical protein